MLFLLYFFLSFIIQIFVIMLIFSYLFDYFQSIFQATTCFTFFSATVIFQWLNNISAMGSNLNLFTINEVNGKTRMCVSAPTPIMLYTYIC